MMKTYGETCNMRQTAKREVWRIEPPVKKGCRTTYFKHLRHRARQEARQQISQELKELS